MPTLPSNGFQVMVIDAPYIFGQVLTFFASASAGSLLGKWLVERDLDRRRAQLRVETESRLEVFRSELTAQRTATDALRDQLYAERQLRFSMLQQRRAAAMEDVYEHLIAVRDALSHAFTVIRDHGEVQAAMGAAADAGDAYRASYRRSRLFFSADLADKLHEMNDLFAKIHNSLMAALASGLSGDQALASVAHIDTAPIPAIADEIAARFRRYFGVDQFDDDGS